MAGNKGFADTITRDRVEGDGRVLPRAAILSARANGLARLASGGLVSREHELVDPARCRIWEGHNRDYGALDKASCADLIDSLKAQGRQEIPALVRRVTATSGIDFEVICGARRHWSVSWLRAHDHPEFRFLVEPRELTDEEAFRLADLENRNRKDLSDYERAMDYDRAIKLYYGGQQRRMVERLEISESWLSRYLQLARLPAAVIAAFGSPHLIQVTHAAALAPLLRAPATRERVLAEAEAISVEDGAAFAGPSRPAAVTVRRLLAAARENDRKRLARPMITVHSPSGHVVLEARKGRGGVLDIHIPARAGDRDAVLVAIAELFDRLQPGERARAGRRRPV